MPRTGLKRAVVGRALASGEMEGTLLPKWLALPIFSSDALSSVAYATEAALVVLMVAAAGSRGDVMPISIAVAALLAIVALSYRQTVRAYETSGGAYVVAKANLGTLAGLTAAASLLTDYVLTVAVSVSAGILALTSAAPSLQPYKVELALGAVGLITFANLRGVREAGLLFAIPTYGFIGALFAMIAVGIVKCTAGTCPTAVTPHPISTGTAGAVGIAVLLRAFASGSSALTGVEAIANGVSAFRRPQSRNAAMTLTIMAVTAIVLFLGVSYLTVQMKAAPSATDSVLSQVARATFPTSGGTGFLYYVVQAFTLAILVLAANTSYQGFPRLAAILARDRFFARQFVNLGDRLVYSNGILFLAGISAALIAAFQANVNSLIHLYVVGVFTAFTLSQSGMVRYWFRHRRKGWRRAAAINGVGAAATGIVAAVVIETKFLEGAWAVIVMIPLLVAGFYGVNRHYRRIARRLRAGVSAVQLARAPINRVLLNVETLDTATERAAWYAKRISGDEYRPIHVPTEKSDPGIRPRWRAFSGGDRPLEVHEPREGATDTALEIVWRLPRGEATFVTFVVPETFRRRSLLEALSHRSTFRLKLKLLGEPGVAICDVPLLDAEAPTADRLVCRILVSGGNAAALRTANYARTLGIDDTRAVFFAFDADERERVERDWEVAGIELPLEVHEAPYRDLGDPLLAYLRGITADEGTIVSVVMPELVVSGWRRVLHNQRALYVKRLLLFEPRVILTSVPYQLG